MKKLLFLISLCTTFISVAQNLESKIPSNAEAVISVNGNRLLELMSIDEFEDLDIAKELFKEVSKNNDSTAKISSLKDFGIDINSKVYYFYQTTDSIIYHSVLYKLNDRKLFEKALVASEEEIVRNNNMNISTKNSSATIWNDNILLFTAGDATYRYFQNNEERFLTHAENEGESLYNIQDRVQGGWIYDQGVAIFNNNESNSILKNSNYLKRKDDNAAATFWINNYGELIHNTMKYSLTSLFLNPDMDAKKTGYGIDGMWGSIYLDDTEARITADMEINDEWKKIYKNMYNSKIGNEFLNYFNQDKVLAYTSMSFNMEGMLEEYPAIVSNIYGEMMPKYREETDVVTEVISVLLDEEAIGNVITGNMLFVLNDIVEREVTYTTYEYDDDYNRTEVANTKTEPIPDFTIMIGSKNKKLLNKLIRLGAKHGLVSSKGNYYMLKEKTDIPVDIFFAIKDDIAFFTSSEKQMMDILSNKATSNSGKHKKMIRNNISTIYVNGKQLMHKLPDSAFSKREIKIFNFAKENLTDAYFTTSRMKGNKIHLEMKMDTPIQHGNSLKFFLDLIELSIK